MTGERSHGDLALPSSTFLETDSSGCHSGEATMDLGPALPERSDERVEARRSSSIQVPAAPSVKAIDIRLSVDGNTVPCKTKVAQLHFIYFILPISTLWGPSSGLTIPPSGGHTDTHGTFRKPTLFLEFVVPHIVRFIWASFHTLPGHRMF